MADHYSHFSQVPANRRVSVSKREGGVSTLIPELLPLRRPDRRLKFRQFDRSFCIKGVLEQVLQCNDVLEKPLLSGKPVDYHKPGNNPQP